MSTLEPGDESIYLTKEERQIVARAIKVLKITCFADLEHAVGNEAAIVMFSRKLALLRKKYGEVVTENPTAKTQIAKTQSEGAKP